MLASLFGVGLTTLLTAPQVDAWGWRVPYLFGLLIGPIGLYMRRHLDETPEFLSTVPARTPLADLLGQHWPRMLLAFGSAIVSNSSNYLILYMPTYAIRQLHLPAWNGFLATLLGGLILTFGSPLVGHWSDRVGRTRIMLTGAAVLAISAWPAFFLLTASGSVAALVGVVCWLSLWKTAYSGVLPSLLAELFPTRIRASGIAISYNLSVLVFGGFAPFVAAWLIAATGSKLAPSFYLIATAVASIAALLAVRRRGLDKTPRHGIAPRDPMP